MAAAGHHTTIWFTPAKEQVHGSHGAVREFGDPFCLMSTRDKWHCLCRNVRSRPGSGLNIQLISTHRLHKQMETNLDSNDTCQMQGKLGLRVQSASPLGAILVSNWPAAATSAQANKGGS
jgi:hypothetical protein